MSDVIQSVAPLSGAAFTGFASVEEIAPRGAIVLRGDLSSGALRKLVTGICGADMPAPLGICSAQERSILWMSPDELLLLMPIEEVAAALARIDKALNGKHFLAEDVSDMRAGFLVTGEGAREALAKLTPADVSPEAFGAGSLRRSKLGQIAAAFWINDEGDIEVICFRSVAQYAFDLLCNAAKSGSEVGYFSG